MLMRCRARPAHRRGCCCGTWNRTGVAGRPNSGIALDSRRSRSGFAIENSVGHLTHRRSGAPDGCGHFQRRGGAMTILPAVLYDDPGACGSVPVVHGPPSPSPPPSALRLPWERRGVSPCDTTTGASDRSSGRGCAACRRACAECPCTMSARIPFRPRRPAHQCTCSCPQ